MSDSDLDFLEEAAAPAPDAEHYAMVPVEKPKRVKRDVETLVSMPGRVRELPHSIEAEECVLSLCMIDGGTIVAKCIRSGITDRSFYDSNNATVFEVMMDLFHRNAQLIDIAVIAEELKAGGRLKAIGGAPHLVQISNRVATTAQADYYIDKVRGFSIRREAIRSLTSIIEDAHAGTGGIDDLIERVKSKATALGTSAKREAAIVARPITDFDYPTADDPNVLLGQDDYLGRGGGMLFVSHAGAGKSSFILDACMSWGIGEPWLGIKCNGPLKSLIIQAEDSERYVGKVVRSFADVRELDAAQRTQLKGNVCIAKVKGITGDAFFSEVERLVEIHNPDLVIINPIYIYAEGDISKSEAAQPFLAKLDWLNREERFGIILVHHTGKPQQKATNGKRQELDDWETIYMGFGSSYLANWPRCSALLEPRPGESGRYWLKLGKAGGNAGVTRKVEIQEGGAFRMEPTTRIPLRHSRDKITVAGKERSAIYWVLDEWGEDPKEKDDRREDRSRRKRKHNVNDFRVIFTAHCPNANKRQGINRLYREAMQIKSISKGAFGDIIDEALDAGIIVKHEDDGLYYVP